MKTIPKTSAVLLALFALVADGVTATTIFSDDFESGTLANWTTTGTSPLTIDNTLNAQPVGGAFSALMNVSTDRMHRNIIADNGGSELSGYSVFTSWWYDDAGAATRFYNEVRGYSAGTGLPNGGTTASGSLAQLFAIGKYNTVTLAGEVYSGSKYQARVAFGANAGWFNLNASGSPNRSVGWHKFTIERMYDGSTINFYVDDILSRTITGATVASWDTAILGPGLGTTAGNAWTDGFVIAVPEPTAISLGALAGLALFAMSRRQRSV